jgi:hypothetical protein
MPSSPPSKRRCDLDQAIAAGGVTSLVVSPPIAASL